jgi:hypothetical protein
MNGWPLIGRHSPPNKHMHRTRLGWCASAAGGEGAPVMRQSLDRRLYTLPRAPGGRTVRRGSAGVCGVATGGADHAHNH